MINKVGNNVKSFKNNKRKAVPKIKQLISKNDEF